MINIAEQLKSKINMEFNEQLQVLSKKFYEQPVQIAQQISVISAIHDAFERNATDIIKPLSLPAQGRLLQSDNLLAHFVELHNVYAKKSLDLMTDFLQDVLAHAELPYTELKVS